KSAAGGAATAAARAPAPRGRPPAPPRAGRARGRRSGRAARPSAPPLPGLVPPSAMRQLVAGEADVAQYVVVELPDMTQVARAPPPAAQPGGESPGGRGGTPGKTHTQCDDQAGGRDCGRIRNGRHGRPPGFGGRQGPPGSATG